MITKICGIKNEDTLICCEDNNVDFFGMIFYPILMVWVFLLIKILMK